MAAYHIAAPGEPGYQQTVFEARNAKQLSEHFQRLIGQLVPADGISIGGLMEVVDHFMNSAARQSRGGEPFKKGYSHLDYSANPFSGVSLEQRLASSILDDQELAIDLKAQKSWFTGEYASFEDKGQKLSHEQAVKLLTAFDSVDFAFHDALFKQSFAPIQSHQRPQMVVPEAHMLGKFLHTEAQYSSEQVQKDRDDAQKRVSWLNQEVLQGQKDRNQALLRAAFTEDGSIPFSDDPIDAVMTLLKEYKEQGDFSYRDVQHTLTTIQMAADQRGDVAGVIRLLAYELEELNSQEAFGQCPLHLAAEKGFLNTTKAVLKENPRAVDIQGGYGQTPLQLAAGAGHHGVVQFLLQQGLADPNAVDAMGQTALHKAACFGRDGIADLLIGTVARSV